MPTVPTGYSLLTVELSGPSPSGAHICNVTYGLNKPPTLELAEQQEDAWLSFFAGVLYAEYTFVGVTLRDETHKYEVGAGSLSQPSGATIPPQCCALVRKGTGMIGKKNRGRMYIPGILADGDVTDSGTITGTPFSNLTTDIADLYEGIVDATGLDNKMVILHTDESTPTEVIGLQLESAIATQRRRFKR